MKPCSDCILSKSTTPRRKKRSLAARGLNVYRGTTAVRDFVDPRRIPYTPLVEIPPNVLRFDIPKVRVFVKLMGETPLGSAKHFAAFNMLLDAERSGKLEGVTKLVEYSSGNTALALAMLARAFGIPDMLALVSSEMSGEQATLMRLFGADVERIQSTPGTLSGGVSLARELGKLPGYLNLDQQSNTANVQAHQRWTGRQIHRQTRGEIGVLCGGMGTAGTTLGSTQFLKKKNPSLYSIGVIGADAPSPPWIRDRKELEEVEFEWQSLISQVEEVKKAEADLCTAALLRTGLPVGPSSGYALAGLAHGLRKLDTTTVDSLRNSRGELIAVCLCADGPWLHSHYLSQSEVLGLPNQPESEKQPGYGV